MKKIFLLIFFISFWGLSIAGAQNESTGQYSYLKTFQIFTHNLQQYNEFVRMNCQEGATIDCYNYLQKINILSNREADFLDVVYLISMPFIEGTETFKTRFNSPTEKIENALILIHSSLTKLSGALSVMYAKTDITNPKSQKYVDLTLLLLSLYGSMEQVLKLEKNMNW